MIDERLVTLKEFKKNKRNVFVSFPKNIVTWGKNKYELRIIDKTIFVVIKDVRSSEKVKKCIQTIVEKKEELKGIEYECSNGHVYLVTGIGPFAFKAYEDDSLVEKFYPYFRTKGQYILKSVMKSIGQTIL